MTDATATPPTPSTGQPNVVLIITDQHRRDHTGFGGNPVVATPHLDALAARSVDFTEAFVANPICMPNRATILTGRMPSVHGTRTNGIALDWDAQTFVRCLRSAGYRTGLVGKAHFQNMYEAGGNPLAGPPEAPARRDRRGPDWNRFEDSHRWSRDRVELPDDYYGFEHVELAVGHADVVSGEYVHWVRDHGVDPAALQGPTPETSYPGWWQVWRSRLPAELHPTSFVRDRSVAYVREASDRPFFLQCSFPDPHHPFSPPDPYFDRYDPADIVLPDTFDDPHTNSVPHLRAWRATRGQEPPAIPVLPFAPTEELYREAAAREYGSITMIDDAIGELLATVEALPGDRPTVVVFTSDHGEMFGDHGLMLKGAMHYRGALRVPLLVADSRRPPQRSDSLVGSIDIAPTILDLVGVDTYGGMQGTSLVSVLDDPTTSIRDALVVEEDEPYDLAMIGRHLRMRTVVTPHARLSVYDGAPIGELFDLDADPDELENRFDAPGGVAVRSQAFEALAHELVRLADTEPAPTGQA